MLIELPDGHHPGWWAEEEEEEEEGEERYRDEHHLPCFMIWEVGVVRSGEYPQVATISPIIET